MLSNVNENRVITGGFAKNTHNIRYSTVADVTLNLSRSTLVYSVNKYHVLSLLSNTHTYIHTDRQSSKYGYKKNDLLFAINLYVCACR